MGDREECRGVCRILSQDLLKPEGYQVVPEILLNSRTFCLKMNRVVLKEVVIEIRD